MGLSQSASGVTMAAKEFVDSKIQSAPVVIFSKTYCPYCKMAKKAITDAGVDLKDSTKILVIELENMSDCADIQDYLNSLTGARSVPRVFIKGKCIGGGSETKGFQDSGQLAKMLKDAGAL